jgi:hypothetical protein
LGGGLATAAAIGNGVRAVVFNPAGLNEKTIAAANAFLKEHWSWGLKDNDGVRDYFSSMITAICFSHDPLSDLQGRGVAGLVAPGVFGQAYVVYVPGTLGASENPLAKVVSEVLELPVVRFGADIFNIERHLIDPMIRALEQLSD